MGLFVLLSLQGCSEYGLFGKKDGDESVGNGPAEADTGLPDEDAGSSAATDEPAQPDTDPDETDETEETEESDPTEPSDEPCRSDLNAPRLIAPMSTSYVTVRAPSMAWELSGEAVGGFVEFSSDSAFSTLDATAMATGGSAAPATDLPQGAMFWRVFSFDKDNVLSCDASTVWEMFVPHRSATNDVPWGSVMDVNMDGYADVSITDQMSGGDFANTWIFTGSPSGLEETPFLEVSLTGTLVNMEPRGSAGDINGDGYADFILHGNSTQDHQLWIGGPSEMTLFYTYTEYAVRMEFAGDVNRDGYGDVILMRSSPYSQLLLGGPTTMTPWGYIATDMTPMYVFGVGDINGDGYADIGGATNGSPDLNIYLGSSSGPSATPDHVFTNTDGAGYFGNIFTAGEFDGDGYSDVIIGGSSNDYLDVVYGSSSAISSDKFSIESWFALSGGDIDGDGYADALIDMMWATELPGWLAGGPSGLDTSTLHEFAEDTVYFAYMAAAGDINGDGFADVVVNPAQYDCTDQIARVHFGGPSGLSVTADQELVSPGKTTDSCRSFVAAAAFGVSTH